MNVRRMTYLSVIVYTRNEAWALDSLLSLLGPFLQDHFELYEIIVVDDASTDGTADLVEHAVRNQSGSTVLIQLSRRHGVEAGIKAGLDRALGDWIIELESADIDFNLNLLLEMFDQGSRGCDIVTASGDGGTRRSRLFYWVVNRYAELDAPLRTQRVRLSSRRAVNGMLAMKEKVRYRKALYAVVGVRQEHVTYERQAQLLPERQRRLNRETSSLAFDILLSFSGFGLRLAHTLSFAFGTISILGVFYAMFVYLFRERVVEGWTTMTVVMCGGFTGLFLILGIIGEYLARILIEVRGRPMYSVRQTSTFVGDTPGGEHEQRLPRFMLDQAAASKPSVQDRANWSADIGPTN